MSAYRFAATVYLVLLFCVPAAWLAAQTRSKGPVRRAQPPKFNKIDPFFEDAFASALQGERPVDLGKAGKPASSGTPSNTEPGAVDNTGSGWAAIISATALEDEIKAQKLLADANVTTPSEFAGTGREKARRDFSLTAMIFGIIAEYDGDVRWKKEAPTGRDLFARTAANAKVGTTGVYNEAKLRKQELADLISGQSFELRDAEPKAKWGEVVNRVPLMQRLEPGRDEKIKPWTADAGQFKENVDKLSHEAQIFAAIGEVLQKGGLEDADDAEYKKFATMLVTGGKELAAACKEKNFDAASKATNLIVNSCEKCHEVYR
jgi:cytochrome c556